MSQDALHYLVRVHQDQSTDESPPIPKLGSVAALPGWLRRVETELEAEGIPQPQWSSKAMLFLENSLKVEIRKLGQRRAEMEVFLWPWDEFTDSLRDVLGE
jgi:hypothetical protein